MFMPPQSPAQTIPGQGGPLPAAPEASPAAAGAAPPMPAPKWHDVTIRTKKTVQKACVVGVPPEEFGISRFARNIKDAGYCFHEVIRRQEDLIAEGYDADQVKAIPTYTMLTNPEELARDTVDEHLAAGGDDGVNETNRQVKITEHYVRMDYEGDGKPALYMVTTGGDQGEVLLKDGKEQIEKVDDSPPFAAMTPVIVTHRFFGRSIADLVMDIQRIKTALLRSVLDNAYLAVNPRVEVGEDGATETTLDDLLVSRPGGVVRTKRVGSIQWQEVPNIAAGIFPLLEYVDASREYRTGVSNVSQGVDAQALQNQSATAVAQVYSAAQARMKLIARIFAETGIKDLFSLLHGIIRKNGSQQKTVELRKQWVTVDPRDWKKRDDMTINVGLGSGGAAEQLQRLTLIINAQKDALAGGKSNLVTDGNLYNSAIELAKLAGHKDGDQFFTDPATQPPPQSPPDPKLMAVQAQTELQQAKQQTDAAHEQAKMQADGALENQKFEHQKQLDILNHQIVMRESDAQVAHTQLQSRIAADAHQQAMAKLQAEQLSQAVEAAAAPEPAQAGKGGKGKPAPQANTAPLMAHMMNMLKEHTEALKQVTAPKRIVRDAQGRVSHVEPITH